MYELHLGVALQLATACAADQEPTVKIALATSALLETFAVNLAVVPSPVPTGFAPVAMRVLASLASVASQAEAATNAAVAQAADALATATTTLSEEQVWTEAPSIGDRQKT